MGFVLPTPFSVEWSLERGMSRAFVRGAEAMASDSENEGARTDFDAGSDLICVRLFS